MEQIQSEAHMETAVHYSYFSSIDQMDRHVKQHRRTLTWQSTEDAVLCLLARRSLSYPGTSWMKVKTIAAAVGKSPRTVNYALAALEEKKIIRRIPVMREKNGGSSSNVIAIRPYTADCSPSPADRPIADTPSRTGDEHTETSGESVSLESLKQEKYKYMSYLNFSWLIHHKWKDNCVKHGSAYMEKVVESLIREYEYRQIKERLRQPRPRRVPRPAFLDYNWLED
ncbi:helix-turn-helix domain-containing protein [Salibacterium sp. K-3]